MDIAALPMPNYTQSLWRRRRAQAEGRKPADKRYLDQILNKKFINDYFKTTQEGDNEITGPICEHRDKYNIPFDHSEVGNAKDAQNPPEKEKN